LHGKLDQETRSQRLQDFQKSNNNQSTGGKKKSKIRVLLSTNLASRGLDIVGLPVVVNYDLPRFTVDFVHRVGRTGRAGKKGTAITFCEPNSEAHLDLIEARHLASSSSSSLSSSQIVVEHGTFPGFEPDETQWSIEAESARAVAVPGATPSDKGLAHDRMFGGIKERKKSKKDKLREQLQQAK
jgi:ATP-dependent RNA helicase RhlE